MTVGEYDASPNFLPATTAFCDPEFKTISGNTAMTMGAVNDNKFENWLNS